jgi:energy-coupling factor transporter transmembrane protein EcfT
MRLSLVLAIILGLVAPFVVSGDWGSAARLGLRALGAATIALLFTSDLSSSALAGALRTLRAPVALVEVIEGLALQLDSLRNVAARIVLARKLRGARGLRGNVTILPELLVRSAERAERVDLARRLRGYDAKRRAEMTAADVPCALLAGLAGVSLHVVALLS